MRRRGRVGVVALLVSGALVLSPRLAPAASTSGLWGQVGEKWNPASRLPDYCKAGYQAGAAPIPNPPTRVNVKNYGARGDGVTDDSAAFLKALSLVKNGAVFIPAGKYVITHQLKITSPQVVLRGNGRGSTILYFPRSLTQAVGAGATLSPGGSWSWSGGFIDVTGQDDGALLTRVTVPALRGDERLSVASTAGLSVGQTIRLVLKDSGGALGRSLYNNQADPPADMIGIVLVDFAATIKGITGNEVVLDRPLRVDAPLAFDPAVYAYRPSVHDVGIEDMTLQFPVTLYAGHFLEPGYNPIDFDGVSDSWIRRVQIINADSGIFLRQGTRRCTVQSVHFMSTAGRIRPDYGGTSAATKVPVGGHHGILADGLVQDNLVTDFQFDFRFIHDLALSAYSTGNVFSQGQGLDMDLDHHRRGPYENLFTDIDVGLGNRVWESGGDDFEGPPSGARETFWNIRARQPLTMPPWAMEINMVGWTASTSGLIAQTPNWLEAIPTAALTPPNIYLAQVAMERLPVTGSPPTTATAAALPPIRIYPDPWRADRHRNHPITFDTLPPGGTLKIFTTSGRLARTIAISATQYAWDLTDESGERVASGIYLYLLTTPDGQKQHGKFAIVR